MLTMHDPPHPGEILKSLYVEPLGLTVRLLSAHLGVARTTVSQLLNERRGLSPEMALRLSIYFDTTPEYWLGLQQKYDLWQARQHFDTAAVARYKQAP